MNTKVLPTKTHTGDGRQTLKSRRLQPSRLVSLSKSVPESVNTAGETAWDTAAMIRRLSSRYPNLDPKLLGWVLLACKLQLPPGEPPSEALAAAEHLIRSDLYDAAARARRTVRLSH